MLKCVSFCFFSPTGGTKKAGGIFCREIAEKVTEIDLTAQGFDGAALEGDLTVIAAPVYGGRIPQLAAERIRMLPGDGPAVTLAVYGNRAYEDALLELNRIVSECGFRVAASAALIAGHSIIPELGAGRPDEADAKEIREFAGKVEAVLKDGVRGSVLAPGNEPYKEPMSSHGTPAMLEGCIRCGTCVRVCPTAAVTMEENGPVTNAGRCMFCMACVSACPGHVRIVPPQMKEMLGQKLAPFKEIRKDNEFFLP